jgi:hypothetical protein
VFSTNVLSELPRPPCHPSNDTTLDWNTLNSGSSIQIRWRFGLIKLNASCAHCTSLFLITYYDQIVAFVLKLLVHGSRTYLHEFKELLCFSLNLVDLIVSYWYIITFVDLRIYCVFHLHLSLKFYTFFLLWN